MSGSENNREGNRFIPSFLLIFAPPAVTGPYLAILLRDLGYGPLWSGALLAVFAGAGIIGPFIFGFWADATGNYRPALVAAAALPALFALPLALWATPALSAVFLALIAFGMRACVSLLDSITTIQIGQAGNYGRIRVWGSIGFILFTLFLQAAPFLKPQGSLNIGLWLTFFSVIVIAPILLLPKSALSASVGIKPRAPGAGAEKPMPFFSAYVLGGLGIIFVSSFAMSAVFNYFPLFMVETLEWDAVPLMFAIAAAAEIPIFFFSARLLRRFGPLALLAASAAGVVLRLLLWAFVPFRPVVLASQLLHALCFGTFHPALVHFVASVFPPRSRGKGMSIFIALGTGLPLLLGALAGGAILEAMPDGVNGFRVLFAIYAAVSGLGVLIYAAMRLGRAWEEKL